MRDLVRTLQRACPIQLIDRREAAAQYAHWRGQHGAAAVSAPLLTSPADNAKFRKTLGHYEGSGPARTFVPNVRPVPLYGLSLAQAGSSGTHITCRFSTPECRRGCVSYAGKGELASVQGGRTRKTQFLAEHPSAFMTLLLHELERVWNNHGVTARVRLNTFSDLPWEEITMRRGQEAAFSVFREHERLRFFDYTKWGQRAVDANLGWYGWPGNYRLVMSASEKTPDSAIINAVNEGVNYAVVFNVKKGHALPEYWQGVRVVDGDLGDDRWSDPKGVIVGLRAKGRMRSGTWQMRREVA